MLYSFASTITLFYILILTENMKSGFLAYLNEPITELPDYTKIVFDTVKYNEGDNYNASSGIYTAPHTAYYLIDVQIYGNGGKADYLLDVNCKYMSSEIFNFKATCTPFRAYRDMGLRPPLGVE